MTLLGASLGTAQASILIDSFDTTHSVSTFTLSDSTVAAPEAIGGSRTLVASLVSGLGPVQIAVNASGRLQFGTNLALGNGAVFWNGGGAPPSGLGGIDLTEGGLNTQFLVSAGTADVDGAEFTLIVRSDATHSSRATIAVPGTGVPQLDLYAIPFTDFDANGTDGGADFTSILDIVMTLRAEDSALTVDFVQVAGAVAVPEPAALVLFSAGFACLAWRRRRTA